MAKLVFGMNQSLDGYVDHTAFGPGPTLFRHFIKEAQGQAGSLYGRQVYEIMRYWDDDQPEWGEDEHALGYLRAAAEQSYMAQVRYNASMVLLEIGEAELAYVELLKLAQNPDIADPIRRDSLRALGLWAVGREDIAEAVAEVAQNAALESNVREAAFVSLNSIEAA